MGGGNSLNIIRVYSYNEHKKFILKDTLNGTIVAGSDRVWNLSSNVYIQLQNNDTNYSISVFSNGENTRRYEKIHIEYNTIYPVSFRPVFEYKE